MDGLLPQEFHGQFHVGLEERVEGFQVVLVHLDLSKDSGSIIKYPSAFLS
jgi:hypothetical protein